MTFVRAVWAFKSTTFAEPHEGFLGNNVAAGHHHGWVFVGGLLFRDRTDEDRVELVRGREGDFNLHFVW